jgi:IS30 family transposase
MPGAPLSLPEREEIALALIEELAVPWAELGRRVGRHSTTVAREVTGHGGRGGYRPAVAQRDAEAARSRPRPARLAQAGTLRDRVIAELGLGCSPVAIWADLAAEDAAEIVCVETIYQALYAGVLGLKPTQCLRSRRRRRRPRQARHTSCRPALPNIAARPAAVDDRTEVGHWEADQIIGARNRSSLLTLTERVTRYAIGVTLPDGYSADAMVAGLLDGLDRIPAHLLRSITFDQGSEWANWPTIAGHYGIHAWFCDPHSPWQRGQIENQNRQWRWWFPRGTDLTILDPAHVDHAADILNNQRRRHLGYHSPASLYAAASTVH